MHENKFEKQVREKMGELGFDPSESVWAGVDKEINKREKRRRPIFWFFILSGLMLAAGGYYFGSDNNGSGIRNTYRDQKGPDTTQGGQIVPTDKKINEGKGKNETAETSARTNGSIRMTWIKKGISDQQLKRKTPEQNLTAGTNDEIRVENYRQETVGKEKNEADGSSFDSASATKITGPTEDKTANRDSVPGFAATGTKKKKENSPAWKIGFSGGAGFSNTYQTLFQSAYPINSPAYGGNSAGNPVTGNLGYTGYPDVRAGFSFGIGVFANRHFSKRISLSAGLGYHYYSTKINIGHFVDSSVSISSPYSRSSSVNAFYRNGRDQSYTNQYHFIELPISANFQLNKSSTLPLIWEAGFSLSYLISSNALHYDPLTNVYFQNNQLLNRMQFNLGTAILIGFHMHHDEIQVGPQVQYGLTGLTKDGTGASPHLFYGGLKISFIPGKK